MSCLAFGANEARLLGSVPVWTGYLYLEKKSDPRLGRRSNWQSRLVGAVMGHLGTG